MILKIRKDTFRFEGLEAFEAETIRHLPDFAGTDDDAAGRRLFSSLTGGKDPEADSEWKEVVEPGLREIFESHVDVVQKDIAAMAAGDDGSELTFPREHGRAWIHTLNQARLALGARHDVTEEDMDWMRPVNDPDKAYAVMQIEFFGYILGFLLEGTEEL